MYLEGAVFSAKILVQCRRNQLTPNIQQLVHVPNYPSLVPRPLGYTKVKMLFLHVAEKRGGLWTRL